MNLQPVSIGVAGMIALIWGGVWSAFLQFTQLGRFLAVRRTWITVVVGCSGVMAVALFAVSFDAWWRVLVLFALASIPIIIRSLHNELIDQTDNLGILDE